MNETSNELAGIVLCGGRSQRMGVSKADLPFGPETMLQRAVRLVSQVAAPVVVVAAPSQSLPSLPPEVIVARDELTGRGPLQGLHAGLHALKGLASVAFVTSCDAPFLRPELVKEVHQQLGESDIACPNDGKLHHSLAAVYRTSVLPHIEQLLADDRLRPFFLFEAVKTKRISMESLRQVDPALESFENLNHPEDYFAAIKKAGFELEPEIEAKLKEQS